MLPSCVLVLFLCSMLAMVCFLIWVLLVEMLTLLTVQSAVQMRCVHLSVCGYTTHVRIGMRGTHSLSPEQRRWASGCHQVGINSTSGSRTLRTEPGHVAPNAP